MTEKELTALISLLDEQNSSQYEIVRSRIIEHGVPAVPFLEQALAYRASDELFKIRCEEITNIIYARRAVEDLKQWGKIGGDNDLMKGYFYFSKAFVPNMQWEEIEKRIKKIEAEMWLEINEQMTIAEKINVLNLLFHDKWNFSHVSYPTFISTVFSLFIGDRNSLSLVYYYLMKKANIPSNILVLWNSLALFPVLPIDDEFFLNKGKDTAENIPVSKGLCLNPIDGGLFLAKELQQDTQLIFHENSLILEKYIESRNFFEIAGGVDIYREFYNHGIIDKGRFSKFFEEHEPFEEQEPFEDANYDE
ncbi:MAG: hypothetical protein LBQ31_11750 [Bacteroidales bacterium]|jgi:hypothetical protein|nr:hypothetical protein [Bacteroidales bacterium]